jgi:hypothetical protein
LSNVYVCFQLAELVQLEFHFGCGVVRINGQSRTASAEVIVGAVRLKRDVTAGS